MITELLMQAVVGVWLGLVSVLPQEDANDPLREKFDWESAYGVFDGVFQADGWLPMTAIILGLAVLLSLRILVFIWSFAQTLWKSLPFT